MSRRQAAEQWAPVLTMYLGMALFIFCAVFWAVTTRLEPMFLAAGGGLLGTSQGLNAVGATRRAPPTPPPVPDSTVGGPEEPR